MATSTSPQSSLLGKRRHSDEDTSNEVSDDKRKKLMEEIEPLLPEGLSKNQRKKMIKAKMKEKLKPEWKKLQKEKEKKKRERRRLLASEDQPTVPRTTVKSMFSSDASQVRIAIDLGYDDLMTDKDIRMVVKQCQRSYSVNRRLSKPVQLYLTGVGGKSRDRFEESVSGYKQWEIHSREDRFMDVFERKDIVFLAAESPNTINELHKDKVYIIGGLVDHNYHKGYCYDEAVKLGIDHGRLPITEHVTLNSRTVLTVNQVFEILVEYEQHKDWKKALLHAIPKRKITQEQK